MSEGNGEKGDEGGMERMRRGYKTRGKKIGREGEEEW